MEKKKRGPKPGAPGAGRPPIGGALREQVVAALRAGGSVRVVSDATGVSLPTVRKIRDKEIGPSLTTIQRLTDLLDAEIGKRAPAGWVWETLENRTMAGRHVGFYVAWVWGPPDTGFKVERLAEGGWEVVLQAGRPERFLTALEAIDAAIKTAAVEAGG